MNEKYMDILKKAAGSSAVMFITRLGIMAGSTAAGIGVGKKVHELSENKVAAVGAGIGTAVAIDRVVNHFAQPLYKSCAKNIYSAAEDVVEEAAKYAEDFTPEEQEAIETYKDKMDNFKEAYNI